MIPDLAIMLAAYMVARLMGTLFPSKAEHYASDPKNLYVPSVVNVLALCVILYMVYDIHRLGQAAADGIQNVKGLFPGSNP